MKTRTEDDVVPSEDAVAETLRAILSGSLGPRTSIAHRATGYTRVSSTMQVEEGDRKSVV